MMSTSGFVHGQPSGYMKKPGRNCCGGFVAGRSAKRAHECLLNKLFGDWRPQNHPEHKSIERALVTFHERAECRMITSADAPDELEILFCCGGSLGHSVSLVLFYY
jgi:hypothetical protein